MAPTNAPHGLPDYPSSPRMGALPKVRLAAIQDGVSLYRQQMGTWIQASLLLSVIVFGVLLGRVVGNTVVDSLSHPQRHGVVTPRQIAVLPLAWQLIKSAVSSVILLFMNAGVVNMGIKQVRGKRTRVGDIFDLNNILPVLTTYAGIVVISDLVAIGLGRLPWGGLMEIVFEVTVSTLCFFALPLIVDKRMGAIEALMESFHTAKSQFPMILLFYTLALIVSLSGLIAFGIGVIFTIPIGILAFCIVYRDFYLMNAISPFLDTPPAPPQEPLAE